MEAMETLKTQEDIKSFDVFNALNLINENLGKAYKEKGYNPLGDEFLLDSEYVQNLLEKAKKRKSLDVEPFLENGNKVVSSYFKQAVENAEALKLDILTELENADELMKDRLLEIVLYLNNRIELLNQAIENLKFPEANSLKLYEDIYNIDSIYGEILKESYFKNFNKIVAIENFLSTCRLRIKFEQFKQEQIKEQERIARQKVDEVGKKIDKELKQKLKDVKEKEEIQERKTQVKKYSSRQIKSNNSEFYQ